MVAASLKWFAQMYKDTYVVFVGIYIELQQILNVHVIHWHHILNEMNLVSETH